MPSKRQQEVFTWQKAEALFGLIKALRDGGIPDSTDRCLPSDRYLTTGNIIGRLEDKYLRVPKKAMLEALRDIGVPHDSNNRFIAVMLHAYLDEMYNQYSEYMDSLPPSHFNRNSKTFAYPKLKPTFPEPAEESELLPEEPD